VIRYLIKLIIKKSKLLRILKITLLNDGGGSDSFSQTDTSYSFRIKDFNENDDKIYLYGGSSIAQTGISVKYSDVEKEYYIKVFGNSIININKLVFLPGFDKELIEGWVSVADGSYRDTEEGKMLTEERWLDKQVNNPIKIN